MILFQPMMTFNIRLSVVRKCLRHILSLKTKLIHLCLTCNRCKASRLSIISKYVASGLYMKIFTNCSLFVHRLSDPNPNIADTLRNLCLIYYIKSILYPKQAMFDKELYVILVKFGPHSSQFFK